MNGNTNTSKRRRAYSQLPAAKLDAIAAKFDKEFVAQESGPLTADQRSSLDRAKRRRGRPRVGGGAVRVSVAVERELLQKVDRFAKSHGVSRSQLIARGLEALISRKAS